MSMNKFNEIRGRIPGIEDNSLKGKFLINGIENEFFGQIEFAFEDFGGSIGQIGFEV